MSLAAPQIALYHGDTLIASGGAWATDEDSEVRLTAAFDRVGAFRFAGRSTGDAALLVTLAPGAYTLQVKSADGIGGAALVEVYDVP